MELQRHRPLRVNTLLMVTMELRLSTATVATTAMLELLDLTSKLVQPASITLLELQVALASHVLVAATVTKLNKLLVKQDFIAISQRLLLPTVFMNHVQLELMQMLPEQPAKLIASHAQVEKLAHNKLQQQRHTVVRLVTSAGPVQRALNQQEW